MPRRGRSRLPWQPRPQPPREPPPLRPTSPDLAATLAALQACVTAAEAEAQQAQAAAAVLKLQLTAVLGVTAPPSRPATDAAPAPAPAVAPRQAALAVGTFKSSVGYLHAQAISIQDIRTLVPVVLNVTSTQYPR
jgi:hypothetical protein